MQGRALLHKLAIGAVNHGSSEVLCYLVEVMGTPPDHFQLAPSEEGSFGDQEKDLLLGSPLWEAVLGHHEAAYVGMKLSGLIDK